MDLKLDEKTNLDRQQIQEMAQRKLQLTTQIHVLNSRWNNREDTEQELQNEIDQLMQQLEAVCQGFVHDLCGLTHRVVRIENEDDFY